MTEKCCRICAGSRVHATEVHLRCVKDGLRKQHIVPGGLHASYVSWKIRFTDFSANSTFLGPGLGAAFNHDRLKDLSSVYIAVPLEHRTILN